MARKPSPVRPAKTYYLYTRCGESREPKVTASVPAYNADGHEIGTTTALVPKFGHRRGARIYTTHRYANLVRHAEELAKTIGMPKSRIWDIFDWNQPS